MVERNGRCFKDKSNSIHTVLWNCIVSFPFFFCVKIALYRRYRSYYRFDRKSVIATLLEFDLQTLNVMEYNDTILKKQTN